MATRIIGSAQLSVRYDVTVNKTIKEIESMTDGEFNSMVDAAIDWPAISKQIEADDFDVYDMEEVEKDD